MDILKKRDELSDRLDSLDEQTVYIEERMFTGGSKTNYKGLLGMHIKNEEKYTELLNEIESLFNDLDVEVPYDE